MAMDLERGLHLRLSRFLLAHAGGAAHDLTVRTRRLRGGLVSGSVVHVAARFRDTRGRLQAASFVVKQLCPESAREGEIYELLRATNASKLAPVLLGVDRRAGSATSLYLEAIAASSRWPWRDVRHVQRVLEALVELHTCGSSAVLALGAGAWNYEAELLERAALTLQHAERVLAVTRDPRLRASLPALRRVVAQLPELRRRLLVLGPLPLTLVHGDMHSGNVVVRRRNGRHEPVLLDWARARIGSPFEDVSSWLQSLGFWEPAVKRKHDTLLATYLACRGLPTPASRDVRDAYWLAGASNGLAGALRYHLELATDAAQPAARDMALRAAHDWLRVIRRADARLADHR
jgi:aminoglycoside phosphotransferase (APT) family kinase protein